jgi:hypothetical protein
MREGDFVRGGKELRAVAGREAGAGTQRWRGWRGWRGWRCETGACDTKLKRS